MQKTTTAPTVLIETWYHYEYSGVRAPSGQRIRVVATGSLEEVVHRAEQILQIKNQRKNFGIPLGQRILEEVDEDLAVPALDESARQELFTSLQ